MTVRKYDHEGRLIEESQAEPQPASTETEESLQSLLQRTESELKEHFPMMVDSVTRLDSVKAGEDRLHYFYTLLNAAAEDVDPEATQAALKPMLQEQTRSLSFLKLLIERGATVSYHYAGKDGKEITVVDVAKDRDK